MHAIDESRRGRSYPEEADIYNGVSRSDYLVHGRGYRTPRRVYHLVKNGIKTGRGSRQGRAEQVESNQ